MELSNRVIYEDESMYGFLPDIIQDMEYYLDTIDREICQDCLDQAKAILEEDDDYYLYKVEYCPMGAHIFTRMVPSPKK